MARNCELVAKFTFPELINTVSLIVGTCCGFQLAGFVHWIDDAPVQTMGVLTSKEARWLVALPDQLATTTSKFPESDTCRLLSVSEVPACPASDWPPLR